MHLAGGQFRAVCVAVEDGEEADQDGSQRQRRLTSNITAAPSRMADAAMPNLDAGKRHAHQAQAFRRKP